ncbi:hypothetical protein E4U53_000740, partial [Claviceps sorghi]
FCSEWVTMVQEQALPTSEIRAVLIASTDTDSSLSFLTRKGICPFMCLVIIEEKVLKLLKVDDLVCIEEFFEIVYACAYAVPRFTPLPFASTRAWRRKHMEHDQNRRSSHLATEAKTDGYLVIQ